MFLVVVLVVTLVGLASAEEKRNGLCEGKRNIDLQCVFALLDTAHGDPARLKEIEAMLLAKQDKRAVRTPELSKRNGLCGTKRNIDLACIFALLDTAHGDPQRLKEIEAMLLASQQD